MERLNNMQGILVEVLREQNTVKMTFHLESGDDVTATIPDITNLKNPNWKIFSSGHYNKSYFKGLDVVGNKVLGSSDIRVLAEGTQSMGTGYIYVPDQKTLWRGMIGFREKFLKQMTTENKNIMVNYTGPLVHFKGTMIIFRHSYKIASFSKDVQVDKWNRKKDEGRLVYFKWLPNVDAHGKIDYSRKQ